MKVFPIEQETEAQEHRPQIERFVSDSIYVIEYNADYKDLPQEIQAWLIAVANNG